MSASPFWHVRFAFTCVLLLPTPSWIKWMCATVNYRPAWHHHAKALSLLSYWVFVSWRYNAYNMNESMRKMCIIVCGVDAIWAFVVNSSDKLASAEAWEKMDGYTLGLSSPRFIYITQPCGSIYTSTPAAKEQHQLAYENAHNAQCNMNGMIIHCLMETHNNIIRPPLSLKSILCTKENFNHVEKWSICRYLFQKVNGQWGGKPAGKKKTWEPVSISPITMATQNSHSSTIHDRQVHKKRHVTAKWYGGGQCWFLLPWGDVARAH